ncbi:hypothetical protein TP2_11200 [Thioclava pacifica DSM 10166]|uniref:Uncharacterized protein n=1 Tax=Thioclava pacifica DSM 10166 TaxID=1353537 RepID=A0A074J696_9RHOB|nr:hypothetical protein TP2_11200 [Thioclava pacifica DSM 10166]
MLQARARDPADVKWLNARKLDDTQTMVGVRQGVHEGM